MPTDGELAQALVDDLDEGFALVMETYQGLLLTASLRLTGRHADADDLTAECLLRAFRGLVDQSPEWLRSLKVRGWLLTILTNTWRNHLRSQSRRPQERELTEAHAPPTMSSTPEEIAEQSSDRAELAALLAALPPRQREAVVLRHVLDLPLAEVALIIGCREGTTKSHISRGLERLRKCYSTQSGTAALNPARGRA